MGWLLLSVFILLVICMQVWVVWWIPRFLDRRANFLKHVRVNYPNLYKEYAREADAIETQNEINLFKRDVSWFRGVFWLLGFPRAETELGKLDLIGYKSDPIIRRYRAATIYRPSIMMVGLCILFNFWADDVLNLVFRVFPK